MKTLSACCILATLALLVAARPTEGEQSLGPIPGQTDIYNTWQGHDPPFPGNVSGATLPTVDGPPAPEDRLWQNLLAAEWVIYSFYQHAVELFNVSTFTAMGLPNTTYDRIQEIRDNEAGHLNIFYREISNSSIKPGPCSYNFGYEADKDAQLFLGLQVFIELSSISFLTALVNEARENTSRSALTAVASVESRHNAWALIDVWDIDPFSGPVETIYPSAEQILQLTTQFIINGSCPLQNPPYPYPTQKLPTLSFNTSISRGHPGEPIQFLYPDQQPTFDHGKEYYAVFMHALNNVTQPFDPITGMSTVPSEFDLGRALIYAVVADEPGAPTLTSMIAGPLTMLQQPLSLTVENGSR